MKLIIIITLMIPIISHAKFKITWEKSNGETYSQIKNTREKTLSYLSRVILNKKHMKCTWQDESTDTYAEKTISGYVKYCKPKNFTVTITDITQELADETTAKQERKDDIAAIKAMKEDIDNWDIPKLKKILKRLIKELK